MSEKRKPSLKGLSRDELEPKAEMALLYLHEEAKAHGKLRAQSDYMDAHVKTVLARCKGKHAGQSMAAADAQAQSDPEYLAALEARRQAAEEWYSVQFLREAAHAHVDAWRTACSNERVNV